MKTLSLALFTAIAFLNTSAFAFPTVGDNAVYKVEQMVGGQTLTAEMKMELTAINQAADQVTIVTSVNDQAQPAATSSLSEMMSLLELVDQCSSIGGTSEAVAAANMSIPTCHIHQDLENDAGTVKADIWFAKVPFGIAKSTAVQTSPAGVTSTQTMILKSYKNQ